MDSITSDFTASRGDTTARARLFGGNRMKLGVMAFNCSHGSTITTVPKAWKLNWADTVYIAQAVDHSGMEALLPVGRWRGYGGPSDFNSTTAGPRHSAR
jgi:dimethylsulfone monooxygenase